MAERRVAVITGATGNLGAALVEEFRNRGYAVLAHGRRATADGLPADAEYIAGDLRRDSDVAAVVDKARSLGSVAALVNNAADMDLGSTWPMPADSWTRMLDASLVSVVRTTQAIAAEMPSGSAIVTISSVEASAAFPGHAHYAAAKAGVESYTRSLALELAPRGIRANAIAPGVIERPGLAEAWPQGVAWWSNTSPAGRPINPRDVANVAVFLASADSAAVNGVVLPVDGGWSASARLT